MFCLPCIHTFCFNYLNAKGNSFVAKKRHFGREKNLKTIIIFVIFFCCHLFAVLLRLSNVLSYDSTLIKAITAL